MAKQIEGEGLEADVEKVPKRVPDSVVPSMNDYDPLRSYITSLTDIYARKKNWFGSTGQFEEQTRETIDRLTPYALFNEDGNITFPEIPFEEYLNMLEKTSPTVHGLIVGTDMKDFFPNTVDLGDIDSPERTLKWNPFSRTVQLARDDVVEVAYAISRASAECILIPDSNFLSLYLSKPQSFLSYLQASGFTFTSPTFLAHRGSREEVKFTIETRLPSFQILFGIHQLERAMEQGVVEIAEVFREFENNFLSLSDSQILGNGYKNNLAKILKGNRPDLFYDGKAD